jgi:hypothetical protein
MVVGLLPDVEPFGSRCVAEQDWVGQTVVHHDVGLMQAFDPAQGDQPRVAGSGAYQVDFPPPANLR